MAVELANTSITAGKSFRIGVILAIKKTEGG
jgi:hypothetical protein